MPGAYSAFFQGGVPIFVTFQAQFFSAELILSNLRTKIDSRGSGGMMPQKIFENLHTVMVILLLFKLYLRKVCHIFGP